MAKNNTGTYVPVSNEENKILEKFDESFDNRLYRDDLELRENTLASKLYTRGVLDVKKDKGRIFYKRY